MQWRENCSSFQNDKHQAPFLTHFNQCSIARNCTLCHLLHCLWYSIALLSIGSGEDGSHVQGGPGEGRGMGVESSSPGRVVVMFRQDWGQGVVWMMRAGVWRGW